MIKKKKKKQSERSHAETYPYAWAYCIVVYGGFALQTAYRWRNLRRTEDRVRSIQKSLRKLVKSEEGANSTKSVEKTPSTDKTLKQLSANFDQYCPINCLGS